MRSRNYTALGLLIVGKAFGIAGLAVGSTSRIVGGSLLALDALLIISAIVVSLMTMRARAQGDDEQKALLRQMMEEGTLKKHLLELEAEASSSVDARKHNAAADVR